MGAFRNLTGHRFGRLTVLARAETVKGNTRWDCACDCGEPTTVCASNLTTGRQVSCGCYMREVCREIGMAKAVHGHAKGGVKTGTYTSWVSMIQRTTDTNCTAWPHYGGKGIGVCDRWRYGEDGKRAFECFLADMGERPAGKSLDRWPNQRGGYEPSNCRWATVREQAFNRYTTKLTDEQVADIRSARRCGTPSSVLAGRFGVHPAYVNEIVRDAKRAA